MNVDLPDQNEGKLLTDESFINYCLQRNANDIAYWDNFIISNPHEKEHLEELKDFVLLTAQHSKQIEWQEQWEVFKKKAELHKDTSQNAVTTKYRPLYKWIAAASIISIIALSILWHQTSSKKGITAPLADAEMLIKCNKGEKKTLKLADGTTVTLNSDSRLTVSAGFNKSNRIVSLEGEAYFDVAHDTKNQFVVKTQHAEIKDIGTVFNVRNYIKDGVMEATLIKGKIEIMLKDLSHKKVTLEPSQKFVIQNDIVAAAVVNPSLNKKIEQGISIQSVTVKDNLVTEISWVDNKLSFVNKPLCEIANDLERNFDVRFVFKTPAVMNYRYTGMFENQSLDEIMKILKLSRNIDYQMGDKELIIE